MVCCNGVAIFGSLVVWWGISRLRKEKKITKKRAVFLTKWWPIFAFIGGLLLAAIMVTLRIVILHEGLKAATISFFTLPEEFQGRQVSGRAMFFNFCLGPLGFLLLWGWHIFVQAVRDES